MITIPRTVNLTAPKLKVIGIGGAGGNALDRIVLDGLPNVEIAAINTDLQALAASVAPLRVQIGQTITRGLGTGGDPEIGRSAAEECAEELQRVVSDATIIFILAGLGGGTGSGALPVIADLAREQNAFVVVLGTLPFSFEGKRRTAQATEALDAVRGLADLVICFENDRMADLVTPEASVREAFATADETLSQCVRAMAALVHRRGLLRLGFDEISSALRGQARAYFGFGEATGANRSHDALACAFKSPLLDHGRALRQAETVVVQVVGGDDFTLNELTIVMDEVNKHLTDQTHLYFGTATDAGMSGQLSIAIFCGGTASAAALAEPRRPAPARADASPRHQRQARREPAPSLPLPLPELESEEEEECAEESDEVFAEEDDELEPAAELHSEEDEEAEASDEDLEEAPAVPATLRHPIFARLDAARRAEEAAAQALAQAASAAKAREEKQEQMLFEPVNRGRFEKSEPTIIDGQDLDVPTFMRRKTG